MIVAGSVGGIAVGFMIVVLLSSGEPEGAYVAPTPQLEARALPAVRAPAKAAPAPPGARDVARGQLAKIQAMHDPSLDSYGTMRSGLEKLIAAGGEDKTIGEARSLLARLDKEYASLAESVLDAAAYAARSKAVQRQYDAAISSVRSVAKRFGEGPWLESTGRAKIDAVVAEVEAVRLQHAEEAERAKATHAAEAARPQPKAARRKTHLRPEQTGPSNVAAVGPAFEFDAPPPGHVFFGKRELVDGKMVMTLADKKYVGYNLPVSVDLGEYPTVEIDVSACDGAWGATFDYDGTDFTLTKSAGVGSTRVDLSKKLGSVRIDGQLTIRSFGRIEIERIRFVR